jgi:hypothetical protein
MPLETWTSQSFDSLKMLLYGDSGVGKTVFASTAPAPIFLDADKGMLSIRREVGRYPIEKWSDLQTAFQMLVREKHGFKTVVVDGLNEIQRICMDNVIDKFSMRRTYENLPSQSDWGKMLDDFEHLVRSLRSLPLNVIFIAHASNKVFEDDRIWPQFSGKQTANKVCGHMDIVSYMFVQKTTDKVGSARVMGFDLPNAVTKDRSGRLPPVLAEPTWDKMLESFDQKKES